LLGNDTVCDSCFGANDLPAADNNMPKNSQDIGTPRWQLGQIYVGTPA
jgi:hypothetical protein